MAPLDTTKIRALLFDVFGTCVDWRSTVTTALYDQARTTLNDPTASLATTVRLRATDLTWDDWARFAQEWRNEYKTFVRGAAKALEEAEKLAGGGEAQPAEKFKSVDQHHLDSLQQLLARWQLDGLWTPAQVQRLSLVWHRLAPWPDSPAGIEALNEKKTHAGGTSSSKEESRLATATLSNGNTALLRDLTAHARLPFAHIFSAEDFAAYKPHPKTYLGAARRLGLRPEECALVAAHLGDLKAAAACGLGTVYVERPAEEDWGEEEVRREREAGWVGLWIGEGEGGFARVADVFSRG
ncbi:HAD-superfamily hydrolase subfamily IA variant 2 [Lasiodiplodia theobromae]|uniref:(S)-2-haloacid dehalogenase 1 n=1 Tax=Lasiodiplodia theobromae TaxID=45133 RepID=A0A5N5CUA8_9PEZI|nr:HAD-superfamily hydrolase subfamily IA variant 2 [Lasiodiplodia theobromae]KAB2568911.1 (S)-2-haloacid dehalogenase 1 [Lasiodiplodia theobromae]KAF4536679.1 HAD-superfamily hydrolase subfamily IA variant 2 [Lasiodiplodia theobromae]KAF9634488.1 HAD-superfamily hydrolase subfamily IA variant 2 [Lasiodiplodia theobromae]